MGVPMGVESYFIDLVPDGVAPFYVRVMAWYRMITAEIAASECLA